MYSGNVVRVCNSQPDPLEHGPPKRIGREEQPIGEIVAASKKRVSWRFTLGESDRTHEVVLVHSIMSYKKMVQYGGRQMHFSSTATLGDWSFFIILDGLNLVMEIRINEVESADNPKYDLFMNKVPYRRWDVLRRKKHVHVTATYTHPNAPPGNAYGTHRWGPDGAISLSQNEPQLHCGSFAGSREPVFGSIRGSFTDTYRTIDRTQSFGLHGSRASSGQNNGHIRSFAGKHNEQQRSSSVQQNGGKRSSLQAQSAPLAPDSGALNAQRQQPSALAAPKPTKQHEINLIDDFDPSVTVSVQSLIFDPLASVKMLPTENSAAATGPQQQKQQQQGRPVAVVPQPATYVDPFASVTTPIVAKPVGRINFDPYANPNASNYQQHSQKPTRQLPAASTTNQFTGYQQSMSGMPMSASMGGMAQQQQPVVQSSFTGQQSALGGMGNVSYHISQLMNPASLQKSKSQQGKSINIDAFAGLGC
ncbi:unnamed protein product [Peronospora belbahrii]|uniref:Uncharacterized protein n=1 Tax=Peronospora belbahrii TaxID=622444 RepID=A0AAU9KW89_9STRA|nr:unnamed protein product [Peronospora belbahrii]CAH0517026.1 unnamed protein product [Peronospora belbahrii]